MTTVWWCQQHGDDCSQDKHFPTATSAVTYITDPVLERVWDNPEDEAAFGDDAMIDKPNMFERLFARAVKFSPDMVAAIITIFIGKLNALRSKVESGKAE